MSKIWAECPATPARVTEHRRGVIPLGMDIGDYGVPPGRNLSLTFSANRTRRREAAKSISGRALRRTGLIAVNSELNAWT
jgi:hypothetical protein